MRRNDRYAVSADSDTLDDLSRKLAVDLRAHVRKLESHKPLTKEWLQAWRRGRRTRGG